LEFILYFVFFEVLKLDIMSKRGLL